jgi:hypothetical protein
MRELQSVVIGDWRVSLWCDGHYWYLVRLKVAVERVWHNRDGKTPF